MAWVSRASHLRVSCTFFASQSAGGPARNLSNPKTQAWDPPKDAQLHASFARPGIGNDVQSTHTHIPVPDLIPKLERRGAAEGLALAFLTKYAGLGAHDMATNTDLHEGGDDLLRGYKTLVLTVHPEYWTKRMWLSVEAFLASGGSLAYLGGNGAYRRVLYGRTKHGAPKLYKLSAEGLSTDMGADTGAAWGLRYTSVAHGSNAPFRVVDASDKLWEGAPVAVEQGFQVGSDWACGWEMDPPSAHAPPGTRVVARGINPGPNAGCGLLTRDLPGGGRLTALGGITVLVLEMIRPPTNSTWTWRMAHVAAYAMHSKAAESPLRGNKLKGSEAPAVNFAPGVDAEGWWSPPAGPRSQPAALAQTREAMPQFLDSDIAFMEE